MLMVKIDLIDVDTCFIFQATNIYLLNTIS